MNNKINMIKKKLSILKITRLVIQLLFLYFYSSLFTLAFTGFKSIITGIVRGNLSIVNSFTFIAAFTAIAILSVIIGRFFCGWLCAFGTYNDLVYMVSRKIFKKKFKISQGLDAKLKYVKYIILLGIIIFIWFMNLSPKNSINPWDAFAQLPQIKTMLIQIPIAFILLALITVGAIFIERFFCRYLCPLGAIQAILSKFRVINISKPGEKCGKCQICTNNCPMGIDLSKVETIHSAECIGCFKCVDKCYRSNPKVVVFKKINLKWYYSTAAAILIFSFTFWGSKFIKPESKTSSKINSANNSKIKGAIFKDGVYVGVGNGFRPNLKVRVEVLKGKISDIEIISHGETKGYYDQAFVVVPKEIIVAQSTSVDTVSGATKSSNGIISATTDALKNVRLDGKTPVDARDTAPITTTMSKLYKTGRYTGIGKGYKKNLIVDVTISDNKITNINLINYKDGVEYIKKAVAPISKSIIAAQSTNVDAVSGATETSKGIKDAVNKAIEKSVLEKGSSVGETSTYPGVEDVVAPFRDGVYTGKADGYKKDLVVSVTIKNNKILKVDLGTNNETEKYFVKAWPVVPNEIVTKQSVDVDVVSGATRSSNGVINAVKEALRKAHDANLL